MPNRLAAAASPYLRQHQDNPVDWWEWGEEAFREAERRRVPILLSVGYAACHWCHVMAHESFDDPEVAELLNRNFVPVKVDREERPDVDAVYQAALQLLGEPGGWPLTMFLTPKGEPFWGGTYFPPEPRFGRPGFKQVLIRIAELWRQRSEGIEANRKALMDALQRFNRPREGSLDDAFIARVVEAIREHMDPVHGGIGGAPKFPQAPALFLLWQQAERRRDQKLLARLLLTLRRMCQGGIYDHLGGGFCRYAVDARWLVPHFEKMLYDNALLLELLAEAFRVSGDPLFRTRAEETVGWLVREMDGEAGFCASLDADSEGREGAFYLWSAEEIDSLLGDQAAWFRSVYGVTAEGQFEGRNILHRNQDGLLEPEEEERLAALRHRLLQARDRRPRPARDDKVLADWNGLAIAALARAGLRLQRRDWIALAARVFERLVRHLGAGDRLYHSWCRGQRLELAFLDDYAQMTRAALALHAATGEEAYLKQARAWAERALCDFADGAGGLFLDPGDSAAPPVRLRTARDGPTPSPIATFAEAMFALHLALDDPIWRERAERLLGRFAGGALEDPFGHASLLRVLAAIEGGVSVVLVGARDSVAYRELWRTAASEAPFDSVLVHRGPADARAAAAARAFASVCRGRVCGLPALEPDALASQLRRPDGKSGESA